MAHPRKGLSYVLGDTSEKENHILPINAMQFSKSRQQLYTASRDGTVKVWGATEQTPDSKSGIPVDEDVYYDDLQDVAETILKLETSLSSSPLGYTLPTSTYDPLITRSYNVHFDWVNDLKLVNNDRNLVSASADLSLKLIDIEGDERHVQKFQNIHTDYVKKISSIPLQNSLVSGGLDGKVVVWDMSRLAPVLNFENNSTGLNFTSSIYALSNDDGYLISTGGPNNTINLYDRRIPIDGNANLIRKLVGHQDTIRCLLMNSNFILSGSSDSTIKLWDLRNFNVYKNFDVHDDAVWSLCTGASSDPGSSSITDFKEFYSGDKAGNIIKTDLNYLSTHSNYEEDDRFFNSTFMCSDQAYIDEKIGLCTLVAKASSPIISLCVEGENSIFASCYDSLKRFNIPKTKDLAKYQYLRACLDHSDCLDRKFDDDSNPGLDSPVNQSDLDSDFYDIISHLTTDSTNIDIASSVSGTSRAFLPHTQETNESDNETQYTSMFLNITGGPSSEYVNAYKDELLDETVEFNPNRFVDETPIEMLLNPIPSDQILTIPFNKTPFQEFCVTPKSISSKKMFKNKRQLIALYVNGDIKIWDIFICKIVKLVPFGGVSRRLKDDELKSRSKEMDLIFQLNQTNEVLTNWCEVYIRSGKLLVTLSETYIGNVEIYYDELVKDYPFLKASEDSSQKSSTVAKTLVISNDTRFWLGRIFLTSLFQKYCQFEWESDKRLRESMRDFREKSGTNVPVLNGDSSSTEGEDIPKRKKLFSRVSSTVPRVKIAVSPLASTGGNITGGIEAYTCDRLPAKVPHDSIAKMLMSNEHLYKEKYSTHGQKNCVDSFFSLYSDERTLREGTDDEYRPLIPDSYFPEDLLIIVYETSTDLGNFRDLCSFHLGDLKQLEHCDVTVENQLVNQLRYNIPKWIGTPILYNKFPVKEQPKISFHLIETDYALLPANMKIGGKSQKKIKKLPAIETTIKLSSHSMLRVGKILQFLTEKFESRTTEMKMKKPATEWLLLECKGQELDAKMTLQTIKTLIWKSGTQIELYYHRKFD
ncbi:WD40 repeat-like protein [Metschnikowia bicuspidata var. bicuspidata NRRL YB-4993]|uniref:WD40 repeat-like protein n=1 Tax=Metschnikowia bicuspidata var. bicuspidata NRRL YB-4993 TaxID=869754 RepID=A0A1A0H595_9ASCO|nr:WD40 repeat-like protein [Metschnikowia bicuspidata var. bicuspidata NRRL YB-4993]OBA19093.1 WD40 repeat-like protein [Metschnikowia bicuspidata var. bicuspidata NRRL YB-4993]